MKQQYSVYTIGYTAFPDKEKLLEVLKHYGIKCLIDVRSYPVSSEHYQFYSRITLEPFLKENGILYRNYAKEFGARQENPKYYMISNVDGQSVRCVDFERFTNGPEFEEGVVKITKGLDLGYSFVLMCAEKDPIDCHRAIMISRALSLRGFSVYHILHNTELETQEHLDERLLQKYKYQPSFLQTREEQLKDAYKQRNKEIGYKGEH